MILMDWQKEDIKDLLEEYPELTDMTDEELVVFSRELYWKAQGLYDEGNRLESKAEIITLYMRTRGK